MLPNEFEREMGCTCTMDEYEEANGVYMTLEELDKTEFCREWRFVGKSRICKLLFEHLMRCERERDQLLLASLFLVDVNDTFKDKYESLISKVKKMSEKVTT